MGLLLILSGLDPCAALAHGLPGETSEALPRAVPAMAPATDWGGAALQADEPAARAVREADPGSGLDARSESDTLRFGERRVPRPLVATIVRASRTTGVDPVYMMALADKESGFDADVKAATSSAQGLYQFVSGTWLEMVRDYGARHGLGVEAAALSRRGRADASTRRRILALRNDPYVAGVMAGEMANRDRARLETRVGRALRPAELYLAHLLGTGDAGRLLALRKEAPERSARDAFARAARANRSLFTQGGRDLTVSELQERLDGMIDRRLAWFQDLPVEELDPQAREAHEAERPEPAEPVIDAQLRLRQDAVPDEAAPTLH